MSTFSKLRSIDLVKALVAAEGTIPDIARAFERGYGHISDEMLSVAGFPKLPTGQARKLFEALHTLSDFAFSFSELEFLRIRFGKGRSLVDRASVRQRGHHRRYRSLYSVGIWEFDEHLILTQLNSYVFAIANGASEQSRSMYPAGAYVAANPMTMEEMRSTAPSELLDTEKFIPISQMLEGKDEDGTTKVIDALSVAMLLLTKDRDAFQRWMLNPLGGLPALVKFQRERIRQKKRRPFLIARYANLSHGTVDSFSYRKPVAATLDNLDRLCQEYVPPHWKDLKKNRDQVIDGEKVFGALLFDASFLFANFVLASSKYGDRVPIGWGLTPHLEKPPLRASWR